MRIFCMEVKRILLSRRNQFFIMVGIIFSIIVPIFSINTVQYRYINSDGIEVHLNGLDAIEYRRELYSEYDGEVTTEKLEQALSQYQEGVDEADGMDVDDEAFPRDIYEEKIAPVRGLLSQVEEAYAIPSDQRFWSWTPLEEIPLAEMSGFYDKVENYRNAIIDYEYNDNQNVKKIAQKLSQKINRPFQTYGVFTFDAMEFLGFTMFLIVILCGAITAPTITENYENGSDHILRCTKYGRVHFAISKLCALSVVLAVFYLVSSFIHVGILNLAFGKESLSTSMQILTSVVSLAPLNIGQLEVTLVFSGLLTVISSTCVIMFLSAKLNTSFMSMLISLIVLILPTILYFIFGISWLVFIFPSSGVGLSNSLLYQLSDMNFVVLGDHAIWTPQLIYIFTAIELFVFMLLAIRTYCKHQVI